MGSRMRRRTHSSHRRRHRRRRRLRMRNATDKPPYDEPRVTTAKGDSDWSTEYVLAKVLGDSVLSESSDDSDSE